MAERLKTVLGHLKSSNPMNITFEVTNATSQYAQPAFKYTLDSPLLTREQRQFYEDNGFLVIKKLVPEHELQRYRDQFQKICKGDVKVPMLTIMKDVAIAKAEFVPGEKAVTKIQNFQLDEELFSYCKLPVVVDYVEAIIGSNIKAIHTMLINKPPDPGRMTSRHPMHQDLHYFPMRPAEKIVCSWTAMQKVNRQNGCLVVLPGTHKGKLLQHDYPEWEGGVNKMYHGVRDYDPNMPRTHLEMEAGDTVFFHPLLIHGSGMNRTNDFRKSISCHYANADVEWTKEGLQMEAFEEIVEVVARQIKIPKEQIKYEDLWKLKSRTVKGNSDW